MTRWLSLLAVLLPAIVASGQVREFTEPIVIPRQRLAVGVPAPYQASEASRPAAILAGTDEFGTIFRFAPAIRGQLIKTEGYDSGKVGTWWNNANKDGDLSLKSLLCPSARNFSVDGQAGLRNQPYAIEGDRGRDFPRRADGLCVQGTGFIGEHLRFFQVPGTAVVLKEGGGKQAGAMGIYDYQTTRLDNVMVINCVAGIDCQVADARLSRIAIAGVSRDGIVNSGPGAYIDDCHVWGATRAAVFSAETIATNCYFEAARIGLEVLGYNCEIDGLNIGPGTCSERGVLIKSDGTTIERLRGVVAATPAGQSPIAGVEIASGKSSARISGRLALAEGSIGIIVRGQHHQIDFTPGWIDGTKATAVRVEGDLFNTKVDIRGAAQSGTILDLSASNLNKQNGGNNEFHIDWTGAAKKVIYPGGGTQYNLAPGTRVWVNGVLQKL
jgi:hypothetical protein